MSLLYAKDISWSSVSPFTLSYVIDSAEPLVSNTAAAWYKTSEWGFIFWVKHEGMKSKQGDIVETRSVKYWRGQYSNLGLFLSGLNLTIADMLLPLLCILMETNSCCSRRSNTLWISAESRGHMMRTVTDALKRAQFSSRSTGGKV